MSNYKPKPFLTKAVNDYLITVPVVKATGWQQYLVRDAKSKADALARFRNGDCQFQKKN